MARNIDPDTRQKSLTREPSGLTLLRGRKPATKTLGSNADGELVIIQGYQNQTQFSYDHVDVPDIYTLHRVLAEISKDPNTFVIRGALRGHVNANGKVYRRKDVEKYGDDAHFEECPRCVVMIDFDKLPLDNIDLGGDPEGTAKRMIRKYLAECYQGVSFVWQLSSSAGIGTDNGLLSVHIWFIYDRPIGHDELKVYHALKAPDVDRAVFRTVQVHYVAAPIFEDGVIDHLPKRIGLVELNEDKVSLPELPPEVVAKAHRTVGQSSTGSAHGLEEKLKLVGDGEGLEGFHAPLIAAASSYVCGKLEQEVYIDCLKARLRRAINDAPKRVGRDVSHYLSDEYLKQNIDSAMSKFCQALTTPLYSAPTMDPHQARETVWSHLLAAADQHFDDLDEFENNNKPYQKLFSEAYARQEAAANQKALLKGCEYVADPKGLERLAHEECRDKGLTNPGRPPTSVFNLVVGVGLGKTEQAFTLIKHVSVKAQTRLMADRQADAPDKLTDDTRIALQRLTRTVLAVPTHKLADEAVERAQGAGLSAAVFRGRLYVDKDTGQRPMCKRADSVQQCIDAGLPVAQSMCKSGSIECKFRWRCGYYAQMDALSICDVVVAPHASLFHEKPSINSQGMLIIDEQFAFDGVRKRRPMPMSIFGRDADKVYSKDASGQMVVDVEKTNKLRRYHGEIAAAINGCPDGNLSAHTMRMFRIEDVAEVIGLEWQTVVRSPVYPGMSRKKLIKALASAASINRMRLRVTFWKALLVLLNSDGKKKSGWLIRDTDEEGHVIVQVGGRANIKKGWFDGFAVCLDATSSPELTQLYFPKNEVTAPPPVEAIQANVTVLQTIDKSFSASMCNPDEMLEEKENKRRTNRAREIYRFICLRASEFRGQGGSGVDVLVICQQALETHLIDLGLPDNVEITHFNANRGIDRWGGVRGLITIGRTLPSPNTVEVLTENMTGWAVEKSPDGKWYPRRSVGIDVGGVGFPVQAALHPDPMVEAVRWQICEAELIQSAGRGRGVNRTVETPLQLDVLSDTCLPLTVQQPVRWNDNAPGRIEEMVAIGLLPSGPAAAALIYPDLWPTEKAAKMAASSARSKNIQTNFLEYTTSVRLKGPSSLLNNNSRDLRPFSTQPTSYRLLEPFWSLVKKWGVNPLAFGALSKMRAAQARVERPGKRALKFKLLFDSALIPDLETWLSVRTGLFVEVTILAFGNPVYSGRSRSDQKGEVSECANAAE